MAGVAAEIESQRPLELTEGHKLQHHVPVPDGIFVNERQVRIDSAGVLAGVDEQSHAFRILCGETLPLLKKLAGQVQVSLEHRNLNLALAAKGVAQLVLQHKLALGRVVIAQQQCHIAQVAVRVGMIRLQLDGDFQLPARPLKITGVGERDTQPVVRPGFGRVEFDRRVPVAGWLAGSAGPAGQVRR